MLLGTCCGGVSFNAGLLGLSSCEIGGIGEELWMCGILAMVSIGGLDPLRCLKIGLSLSHLIGYWSSSENELS